MIKLQVTPDTGDPFVVDVGSRDILVWERTAKGKSLGQLQDNPQMGDLYRLAHITARRTGLYAGDLDSFETSCDIQELGDKSDDEDGEGGPTQPAP